MSIDPGQPHAWLRDLIARRLEQALRRPVEVLVTLELNASGALHVHGIIAGVGLGEDAAVKSALILAGGPSYGARQVRLAPSPDSGWASYCAKDFLKTFRWSHRFAATRGLAAAAREVFAGMVAFVQECEGSIAQEKTTIKSTLTVDVASALKLIPCDAEPFSLTMFSHTQGEASCTSERSRKNSSRICMRG